VYKLRAICCSNINYYSNLYVETQVRTYISKFLSINYVITIVANNYFISNTLYSSKTTLTMTFSGIANSFND